MPAPIELPAQFAALTAGVGVAELPGRTLLEIRGQDRVTFLHAFCTNNIKALQPGQTCEVFITSPQGKTLGHGLVTCYADHLLLNTSPGQAAGLIKHFDRYLISEDVQFVDRSADLGVLLVAGPRAADLLKDVAGAQPTPYVASGFFVLHPAGDGSVRDALIAQGAVPCGEEAVEAARIAAGFPLFGRDITEDNLPQEVGRDAQAISFTKGCYLGQETVARLDALGHVNKKLVGLKFAATEPPPAGTPLLAGEKEVGRVTSAAMSPDGSSALALGYVRSLHAKPGTALQSPTGSAEVISLPGK